MRSMASVFFSFTLFVLMFMHKLCKKNVLKFVIRNHCYDMTQAKDNVLKLLGTLGGVDSVQVNRNVVRRGPLVNLNRKNYLPSKTSTNVVS